MAREQLAYTQLIYENRDAGVKVYTGKLAAIDVVIKEQLHSCLQEANKAIKEAMCQVSLDHGSICRVWECFVDTEARMFKSVIVMERMERDVMSEVKERAAAGRYWTEEQLLHFLQELVSALAYCQGKGVCHRDIKPQNIFLGLDPGVVKIGDFGVSFTAIERHYSVPTLAGSPYYLSPELKSSLVNGQRGGVSCDIYKSDVYSLGLTFVVMALLDTPMELTDIASLQQKTEEVLGRLAACPSLQFILAKMLTVDPSLRPDFCSLKVLIESLRKPAEAVIESEPLEQPQEEKKQETCCGCREQLDSFWKIFSRELRLECGHVFHALSCFKNYITQILVYSDMPKYACPICKKRIDPKFVENTIGSAELSRILSQFTDICSECEQYKRGEKKGCGHFFCQGCYQSATVCKECKKGEGLVSSFANFIQEEK